MEKIIPFGRLCFAVAIIGLGILQFIYGDFVPGRAPAWPASWPGRLIWAYVSGAVLIATGAAIISGKKAQWMALLSALMIFVWAFLRHIPVVAAAPVYGGEWTAMGKSLVFIGGFCAVAASMPAAAGDRADTLSAFLSSRKVFTYLGRVGLGYFMIQSGIQHFMFIQFVATLVPTWIPGAYFWSYFAGVALIAGGAGLIFPPTARLAAGMSGLMIFLWFVMLHIPRAVAAATPDQRRNEWTAVCEALAFAGLGFVLTKALRKPADDYVVATKAAASS